jgi:hypothetical protein
LLVHFEPFREWFYSFQALVDKSQYTRRGLEQVLDRWNVGPSNKHSKLNNGSESFPEMKTLQERDSEREAGRRQLLEC